jgi:hypothetical protein
MGLLGTIYEFERTVPSLDEIQRTTRELSSERLVMEGTLNPTPDDVREARIIRPTGVTILMRDSGAEFWIDGDRPRCRRWVDLSVSLDGTKVSVNSNYAPLFRSACDAMAALGGHVYASCKRT